MFFFFFIITEIDQIWKKDVTSNSILISVFGSVLPEKSLKAQEILWNSKSESSVYRFITI